VDVSYSHLPEQSLKTICYWCTAEANSVNASPGKRPVRGPTPEGILLKDAEGKELGFAGGRVILQVQPQQ